MHIKNGTLHIPGGAELGDILTNGGIIEAIGPVMMGRAMGGDNQITLFAIEFGRDAAFYENMAGTGAIFNWTQHSIPGVDDLFAQAKDTTDPAKRVELYTRIMNLINDDSAFVALYFPQTVIAATKGLQVERYWNCVQPKGKDLFWK